MVQQRLNVLTTQLQMVKPNDPVLASQWNIIVDALQQLITLLQQGMDDKRWADMFIGELQEDAVADAIDFEVAETQHNEGSGGLTTIGINWDRTFEPQEGLWLEGERLGFFWDRVRARYCMLPMVQMHFGKMDADIGAGESKTMSVWQVNSGTGAWEDTNKNITVWDWLLKQGSVIEAGKKVIVAQFLQSRRWIIIAAECP